MRMGFLSRALRKEKGYQPRSRAPEGPLRAELFSDEQLCRHAAALAEQHQLDPKPGPNRLLPRLADNEQTLIRAYDLMTGAEAEGRRGSPAGEWLLDNFYLVEEQIRLVRSHLPRTYSHELPRLSNGATAGFPRVYDIALELIAHADGRVDAENVRHFVAAYQSVNPLTLGELWAVPIMLRLGLIENLRRVSAHVVGRRRDLRLAERWGTHDTTNWAAWWENEAGTVDQALFIRKCRDRGIDFESVKEKLFDPKRSGHGRLRWQNIVSTKEIYVGILGKREEELMDFLDMYENTYGEKEKLWAQFKLKGAMREKCDTDIITSALNITLSSRSIFSIELLMDYLYLADVFKGDPYQYRINVPGTIAKTNWSLALPLSLEELLKHKVAGKIEAMVEASDRIVGKNRKTG